MAHEITIWTRPKTGRKVDPPRSRWTCSCGAGNAKLQSPEECHVEADAHVAEVRK